MEAVTFDFWGTLVGENTGEMRRLQIARFGQTLAESGHEVGLKRLEALFHLNWLRFEEAWRANSGPYTPADTVDFVCGQLGVNGDAGMREALLDGFREVGEAIPLQVAYGLEGCLLRLTEAGVRLGIVCDVGLTPSPTLRKRLEDLGLLAHFDAWAFSDETGWFKPAAQAFKPALDGLGVSDPSRAAHVGDNRRTDVAGAQALGMTAVRYTGLGSAAAWDRSHEEGPEADVVIDDMRALPGVLGL